jgi:hypothetical protein
MKSKTDLQILGRCGLIVFTVSANVFMTFFVACLSKIYFVYIINLFVSALFCIGYVFVLNGIYVKKVFFISFYFMNYVFLRVFFKKCNY